MFNQLGVIGCGLMGGSFALALKRAGLVKRVVGYSKSPSTTARARELGVIDVAAESALLAVSGSDIVLIAVPVAATEGTFKAIRHLVEPGVLFMDVGSTKRDVVDAARRALRERVGSFVPAHPIAGKELSGIQHADATLYQNCQVILTPVAETAPALVERDPGGSNVVLEEWQPVASMGTPQIGTVDTSGGTGPPFRFLTSNGRNTRPVWTR